MTEILEKLRPDRDLQCYFREPSRPGEAAAAAVAALSETSPTGFAISGSWRQQFDWAVLEWNRDNVFEHPAFRNLPDGDLSGLDLTYDETRTNCISIDSDRTHFSGVDSGLFAREWAYLRIWLEGSSEPTLVRLADYATAIEGEPQPAFAELELDGSVTAGDYIGLAWLTEQYYYEVTASDTIETAVAQLANSINSMTAATMRATLSGGRIRLTAQTPGANWIRVGVYGYVAGARTERWSPWCQTCSGGVSPTKWRVHLDFSNLADKDGVVIPAQALRSVRKMRWTYAAGWQNGEFQRTEFAVRVSNWTVTGANRGYAVAGSGSRRIENDARECTYSPQGAWEIKRPFNYSGASYHSTSSKDARIDCTYRASGAHSLYTGVERVDQGAQISISVDGGPAITADLCLPSEDELVRLPLGQYGAGTHTVSIEHAGPNGALFNFDFLELAVPTTGLPSIAPDAKVSLATDWDTYHSICLAPERTAWMIDALGFHGRVNHYAGAMWFYELVPAGYQYASAQLEFIGVPAFSSPDGSVAVKTEISVSRTEAPDDKTVLTHLHYIGDTAETIAKAFEMEINRGSSTIRAVAQGTVLTIYSRTMGVDGNNVIIAATPASGAYRVQASGPTLAGGTDGSWLTDLQASPRLNRAARDWSRSFFAALKARGLDAVAALSTELRHGDPSAEAGIAQRCPAGDPVIVNTPAVQTNFSPASIAFWRQAYCDLAAEMAAAGMRPYLQFGEVQWWYFRDARSGMPFYDDYSKAAFRAAYGRDMRTIADEHAVPGDYSDEVRFLPTLIGQFTNAIIAYVRAQFPDCRFEVLYPLDVNDTDLNRAINFPAADWTPAALDCLKTESFGYTGSRNLDRCQTSILFPQVHGFAPGKSAHLIGITDPTTPWQKEVRLARAQGVESVVLFALDQFCLVGCPNPLPVGARRSIFQG
jgi:hypothetical protein